jgi:hypothetical protein
MKPVVRTIALSMIPYAARQRIEITIANGRRRIVDAISGITRIAVPARIERRPRTIVAAQYSV